MAGQSGIADTALADVSFRQASNQFGAVGLRIRKPSLWSEIRQCLFAAPTPIILGFRFHCADL